jgi:hypothetical protein
LNFETNANMPVHFFDPSIPLSLEDFDANVSTCTFNFFNDSSHGIAIIFGFVDYSNYELATSRSNVAEGAE